MSKNHTEKLVIILDKLDCIIKTTQDIEILLHFLKTIYKSNNNTINNKTSSTVKIILTFSNSSSSSALTPSTPTTPKAHLNILKSIESIFSNKNSVRLSISGEHPHNHSVDLSSMAFSDESSLKKTINENIKNLLFNIDHATSKSDAKNYENILNFSFIIDILILMLNQTRYGLKESELREILRMYFSASMAKHGQFLNYFISMTWYTFKYYINLFNISKNAALLASSIENNQILFKLCKFLR